MTNGQGSGNDVGGRVLDHFGLVRSTKQKGAAVIKTGREQAVKKSSTYNTIQHFRLT